ncbi:Eco57I restriction-modification methylase domain-containing protein [Chryseobacterium bernardetii]|uniref:Eco57I restriction-modification methylase domain-containing protein n=1 Tax=Chryseobacterium bernardetii TaxID=1241978 RepID=UPI003AF634B9
MNRIEQLFVQLGYTRENGLFYLDESENWLNKFPYRISKVLKEVIQPYAFYSLHHQGNEMSEHPEPINNPIILFFNKPDDETVKNIPKWTFCFGQAPVVIINNDDHKPLDIYHGYQFASEQNYTLKTLDTDVNIFSLINLTLGKTWKSLFDKHFKNVPKVDKHLLNNIIDARRILIASDGLGLSPKIANRLIGRLLFIRYLIDRRVEFTDQNYLQGNDKASKQASLNEMILSKETLYNFFEYLNSKYSGDLFPLQEDFVDEDTGEIITIYEEKIEVNEDHLDVLYNLFSGSSFFKTGSSYRGYVVQKSLFMVYDFEIIPVELLSNIYENFIGKEEENHNLRLDHIKKKPKQFEIKAYYTPPFIVDYILSQTVEPFLENKQSSDCKVLDPSCGSGIFLVETLRKIIEKEISCSGKKLTNDRLWELVKNNIFGIDIDEDAIEITIFSIYITLLDYKSPKEIENFKFETLKHVNLFGGSEYDFFNEEAIFNNKFKIDVSLDFIIGNPPWGEVKMSSYEKYITTRNTIFSNEDNQLSKTLINDDLKLEIGNKEISQAFLVRVSDFAINSDLKIALVVTGKSLYNSQSTSKNWRQYFLSNFTVTQVLELSGVNNKIVGGNQIFEGAKMAPAIFFYQIAKSSEEILNNIVTHITVKPNRFFNYFRTIVIEKHDVKKILQKNFITKFDGYDWLWKVMLHGNVLDFYFMLRLKNYRSIKKLMDEYNLDYKGGLKIKDGVKKNSTTEISHFPFLNVEAKREFQPYNLSPSMTWTETVKELIDKRKRTTSRNIIDSDGSVGYLPDPYYFIGEKLLVKKGLQAKEDFKAVAAYTDKNVSFTATICSIKTKVGHTPHKNTTLALQSLAGVINSRFFTYYLLNTSSSAGIDRTRADFDEIISAPAIENKKLADSVLQLQNKYAELNSIVFKDIQHTNKQNEIEILKQNVDDLVYESFEITDVERSLINYSTEISLPILKRTEETGYGGKDIFRALSKDKENDVDYLTNYANIFINHFQHRFNSDQHFFYSNIFIAEDFIGFQFVVDVKPDGGQTIFFKETKDSQIFNDIGGLGIHTVTRDLYIQQDVRGFSKNTFYIIKPNEFKCWHVAVGHHDLIEFIDALAKAEAGISKTANL